MNILIETLSALSGSVFTWIGVGLLALVACYSFYEWVKCPYLCHKQEISLEEAKRAIDKPVFAGRRFLVAMVTGIGMTIAGLTMIYRGFEPGMAFILIVAGLVIMQTEPIRLEMKQAVARVVAATASGEAAVAAATESLRTSHLWLVSVHFIMLGGIIAGLLAF